MKINTAVVLFYRRVAFAVLALFFAGVMSYVVLVIFYSMSSTWAAPILLSPSQDRVLSYQPQIATLNLTINRTRSELQTNTATREALIEQLIDIDSMEIALLETIENEKKKSAKVSESIDKLLIRKRSNISQSSKVTSAVSLLLKNIDQELSAGLITSDQAAQRRITLQGAANSITDLNVSALHLETESNQLKGYSGSLGGSRESLHALEVHRQLMELKTLRSHLKVQLATIDRTIELLKKNIAADTRIMQVAMDSPFYKALFQEVSLAFVPYPNLIGVNEGDKIYSCYAQIIFCREAGVITRIYKAEEHTKHPLFKTEVRGVLVEIDFTHKESRKDPVVFIGSKPLFI